MEPMGSDEQEVFITRKKEEEEGQQRVEKFQVNRGGEEV